MYMKQNNHTILPEEQVSSQFLIGLTIFKCVSIMIGVFGNTAVIIYNVFMNNEKSPTTWLIVNLSVTDLLVCLTFYPIWIVELVQIITEVDSDEEFFCKFIYASGGVSINLSILTLVAISFDRYLFITWPLKYPTLMTWQRVYILICSMWIWALTFLPISMMFIGPGEVRGVCRASSVKSVFILLTLTVCIYIPLFLIIFFNYKIFKIARRHRQTIAAGSISQRHQARPVRNFSNEQSISWWRIRKELKALKTFMIVIGVLVACFIPYSITVFLDKLMCNSCIPLTLYISFSELTGINSIINPFIYGIRHKDYRNAYGRLLGVLCSFLRF